MDNIERPEKPTASVILSTVASLKEILILLSGLAITNSIVQLMLQDITVNNGKVNYNYSLVNVDPIKALLFIILIFNIIRFSHGNIRHLDSSYTGELGKGCAGDLRLGKGKGIAIDFFAIFIESIGFAILSFTLQEPKQFFYIFSILLFFDGLWILSVSSFTTNKAFKSQKNWVLNNIVSSIVLFVLLILDKGIYIFSAVLICNTIVDFYLSKDFYFPKIPSDIKESTDKPS